MRGLDSLIVVSAANIRWATGLASSHAAFSICPHGPAVLATDSRYAGPARALAGDDLEVRISRDVLGAVAAQAVGPRVGLESSAGWSDYRAVTETTPDPHPEAGLLETLRAAKDERELTSLRQACRITAEAFHQWVPQVRAGRTEVELARELEHQLAMAGAHDRSFETIVASGPNSAVPHHLPTTRYLEHGDLVIVDFGALVDGYHADCTRTLVVGKPSAAQAELHAAVLDLQEFARQMARPGMTGGELDSLVRERVDSAGHPGSFDHGLGHGVGLEIHESPWVVSGSDDILTDGSPFTLEPGLYVPEFGGVRIEDTVVLVNGETEVLTDLPYGLIQAGLE